MILRRWEKGIQPLEISDKQAPEWITFKKVPPDLLSIEGISWLASLIGKPLNKFVRDELDVKVCIIRDKAVPCPVSLSLELDDQETCVIEVNQAKARDYAMGGTKVWRAKTANAEVVHRSPVAPVGGEGDPVVVVAQTPPGPADPVPASSIPGTSGKNRKSRKNKKKAKKGLAVEMDTVLSKNEESSTPAGKITQNAPPEGDVEEDLRSHPIAGSDIRAGNESASCLQGTGSPVTDVAIQVTEGGLGNDPKASLQAKGSPSPQLVTQLSPTPAETGLHDGVVSNWSSDDDVRDPQPSRKANLGDFMQYSKPAKQKRGRNNVSGIKTRFKTRNRWNFGFGILEDSIKSVNMRQF
ncbi:hypothetical protein LINPERPRIM_LOCUS35165 [Linum perenne]